MADLEQNLTTQPQIAQLELKFKAPPFKGMAVETEADLLGLNIDTNYHHKLVWVRSVKAHYYLANGDGSQTINWKRTITRAVINRYDPEETYQVGESVFLGGKIYSAKIAIVRYHSPISHPNEWDVISGETITFRYLFKTASSVIFYTSIKNPTIEVMLGDIVYEVDGTTPKIDPIDGMVLLENKEVVDAGVFQRPDLAENNGFAYEVVFYTNGQLTEQACGCINVK